jgi:hypothetical protein
LDTYMSLVKRCWQHEPTSRPDFAEVLETLRSMDAIAVQAG